MNNNITPDYIFEASWEVCNQVGGIYTVLSTKAKTLQQSHPDRIIFVGPDFWLGKENPLFTEDTSLFAGWQKAATEQGIRLRTGRWNVPGKPVAVLIDFAPLLNQDFLNRTYGEMWLNFGVNSLCSYPEYNECAAFGIAAGQAIEHFYHFFNLKDKKVAAHFDEWQTVFGIFYLKKHLPDIATLFTTHATSIGRSIAGNNKPLYEYFDAYNGDQMAQELNVTAKHSAEKTAAHLADCFTTVSDITAAECEQLLDKKPDVVTPNGFENDFVPQGNDFEHKRHKARQTLTTVAETLLGYKLKKDTVLVGTCGRYEYKNKGLDMFIDSLNRLRHDPNLKREVLAFVMVPAHIKGARADLQEKLQSLKPHTSKSKQKFPYNFITHELVAPEHDPIVNAIHHYWLRNDHTDKVKIIFVPSYLNGADGIFGLSYYDLLIGLDLTAFPSYYEPWGYTPLESIAFGIPTVTTNLSGFGAWANSMLQKNGTADLTNGTAVLHRTDSSYHQSTDSLKELMLNFTRLDKHATAKINDAAKELSKKALWKNFIVFYEEAFSVAFCKKINN